MAHRIYLPAIFVLSLVFLASPARWAEAAKTSKDLVKATATASKPDANGKQEITIELAIESPFHLYANPVENEDYKPIQTVVTLAAKEALQDVKITYPEGKLKKEKDMATTYKIYEGKVTIKATAKRKAGDASPIEVNIAVQACDDNKCLPQGDVKITATPK